MATTAAEQRNIVVLGGGMAGIGVSHYLLRHTIPAVKAVSSPPAVTAAADYKVIMVSPSAHLYWTPASVRALVSEKLLPSEKLFSPIMDGFTSYAPQSFRFIHGTTVGMDPDARTVEVQLATGMKERSTIPYHALIIATGASSPTNPIWSVTDGEEATKQAYTTLHHRLPEARTIVVGGGGGAGVETAGELGAEYGKTKEITLLSGSARLLEGRLRPALGEAAASQLGRLGVQVRHQTRVQTVTANADGSTSLALSDGSSLQADVYVDCTGLRSNTAFVPAALLDGQQRVETDPATLRVTKAGPRVYALGSCASYADGGIMDVWNATGPLMWNVEYDLSEGRAGREKRYEKNQKEMFLVPVGRKGGVGALFGWKIPGVAVWMIKGRSYFIETIESHRDGGMYKKKKS
ncbi:MAG: hypothetical protein M1816_004684 [Peltula sp. TS41687]|nr:MAG: hypothetical protein M1816_004684 [Peltula sp. TS41687]